MQTWNLHFDNNTDLTEVIRLFYHADIEKYDLITFEDNEENKHSFTITKVKSEYVCKFL